MPTLEWIGKDKVINHHQEVPFRVLERRYSYDEAGQHGYGEGKKEVEGTGGSFSFYDLGEPLLIGENLNESVGTEKIREYIWFMETKSPYVPVGGENPYYLGSSNDTGYYFYYAPGQVTVLDYQFLSTLTEKNGSTVIYADRCSIGADKLVQLGIVFKKIPRDISKL